MDTVTLDDVELVVEPLLSVTLAVQVIVSVPLIKDGSNCQVDPLLVAPPLAVHVYVGGSEPSSASLPVAEQVSKLLALRSLTGEIEAVVIVGSVLDTLIEISVSVPF